MRTFEHLGYILINIKKDFLFREFKKTALADFDSTFIIDENNELILSLGDLHIKQFDFSTHPNDEGLIDNVIIDEKDYLVYMTYLEAYPNWRIYSVLEYDRITVDLILIRNMVYFIAMVVFVISVFIIHKVTERITDPVLELNRAMDIFQNGEWPQPLVPKTDDELRSLVLNF